MKIVFMGTPGFAATILKGLAEGGHDIVAVYTQPDRPKGRSGKPVPSEVKEYALSMNLPVYQPERIKRPEEVELLKTFDADVFVIAAYGQILSQEILDIPKFASVNAHGSLLPKLRGASPIQRAIANGDSKTGITIMRMDAGIDTGDMMAKAEIDIEDTDDEASVYEKLANVASDLLIDTLKDLEAGRATFTPQDESIATYAPMLKKEEGLLDFSLDAWKLDCIVRGYKEWPTAYTYVDGKLLKIFGAKAREDMADMSADDLEPGRFIVTKKQLFVTTGKGLLELLEVQPEGKKRMAAMDYARGAHLTTGTKLNE